jgi:hypothetical protein
MCPKEKFLFLQLATIPSTHFVVTLMVGCSLTIVEACTGGETLKGQFI